MISADYLLTFIEESNAIEGIVRPVTSVEIDAHLTLLGLDAVTVADLEAFVEVIEPGAQLRRRSGMNVRVGDHAAPVGGVAIELMLEGLLRDVTAGKNLADPYDVHLRYENLHPFTDGNGRSGRALWLWQLQERIAAVEADGGEGVGFLRWFYYATLARSS